MALDGTIIRVIANPAKRGEAIQARNLLDRHAACRRLAMTKAMVRVPP